MSLKIQLYLKGSCWKIQTIVILQATGKPRIHQLYDFNICNIQARRSAS